MSAPVITYHGDRSRGEPNARERLTGAAMELYRERGFDQTTVAEIADRAGLTERTFFRYFADKREVLFAGQERLLEIYTATIDAAPGAATPMELVEAPPPRAGARGASPSRPPAWPRKPGRSRSRPPGPAGSPTPARWTCPSSSGRPSASSTPWPPRPPLP